MAELSLRNYLRPKGIGAVQGARGYDAPRRDISLRRLMSSLRIIHISDLHCSSSPHTLDAGGLLGITIDEQDSPSKLSALLDCLVRLKAEARLGADSIVITGDLTDSGDEGDYAIARGFIELLEHQGFSVFALPGNHDYYIEGNKIIAEVLHALTQIPAPPHLDPLEIPGFDRMLEAILANWRLPATLVPIFRQLFKAHPDIADNQARRQRFIQYITPDDSSKYPRYVDLPNGCLILLDSIQGQLDETTGDLFAQGYLGTEQLVKLQCYVAAYQEARTQGKQLLVCLHHSPFIIPDEHERDETPLVRVDSSIVLRDRGALLDILKDQVDGLLFGHTTPAQCDQQPHTEAEWAAFSAAAQEYHIPLINCVNLERMSTHYSVSVIDLGACQRAVFQTDRPDLAPTLS